jgi:hypothetical protein
MGVRGELFSSRIILPNRTYFFNVKENRMGDLYLNIVESKNRETGGFDRQSVILFADDLREFLKGFEESLKVMEKAVREKRHSAPGRDEKNYRREKPDHDQNDRENFAGQQGRRERGAYRQKSAGEKPSKNFRPSRSHDHRPEGGRFEGTRRDGGKHEGNRRNGGKNEGARRGGGKRVVVKKRGQ